MRHLLFTCDWCHKQLTCDGMPLGWLEEQHLYQSPRKPMKEGTEPTLKTLTFCSEEHRDVYKETIEASLKHSWWSFSREFESLQKKWWHKKRKEQREAIEAAKKEKENAPN